jgi:acetyl esterase/lipase
MASAAALEMMAELRANKKPPRPLAEGRAEWEAEAAAEPLPEGTVVTPVVMGGVSSEWITCGPVAETGVVLLLHGGGYRAGSLVTHRRFAARISRATELRVLLPDYRLAPEHPYPAAPDDAEAVFVALLGTGVKASEIVLLGDSAGGGLAITLMLTLKRAKASQPAGAVLMSPWTDLECLGASYLTNIGSDPFMSRDELLSAADDYRGGLPADDPMLSPIHADLSGLPKMLVQAGGGEIMLDDAVVFAKRAQAAGCEAILDVTTEVWHVFQNSPDSIPEVHAAFGVVTEFVDWVLHWD